jgi:hypothetical protein
MPSTFGTADVMENEVWEEFEGSMKLVDAAWR